MLVLGCIGTLPMPGAEPQESKMREQIRMVQSGLRDVPLPMIIAELCGHRVLPWQGEHQAALEAVATTMRSAINVDGIEAERANEAGNAVESHVVAALQAQGFVASRPVGPSGRAHAAGYPDLVAVAPGRDEAFYVEVKTYSAATEDSALRTFYLSPSADFKVTRDAHHLLIAVELVRNGDGRFRVANVRWLDLYHLRCDLKHEFNASNRDLYRAESGLVVIEAPAQVTP